MTTPIFDRETASLFPVAPLSSVSWLLDIQAIYHQPEVLQYPRGQEILAAFPDAERIVVDSHWNIPGLHGFEGNVDQ